uniref:Serine-threonine kinase receptor-associated protein n=1 Tax=Trypanosoma vivax (strain Y486) TaxID=1055687 RepID=G0UCI1_TRYVY|nr:putative eukaryotic translation initiation factor [Trypanosoma vivax Y486]
MNIQATALHGHMKPVTMIRFNREGDLLFSTAKEPNVSVWYTRTGERLGVYKGHTAISACDVNNYSTLLVTGGMDFKAKLWCVESGEELANIMLKSPARAVGFSHDDNKLMVATSRKMGEKAAVSLYNLPFAAPRDDYRVLPVKTAFNPCAEFLSDHDDSRTRCGVRQTTQSTTRWRTAQWPSSMWRRCARFGHSSRTRRRSTASASTRTTTR